MKMVVLNEQMLETVITDIRTQFGQHKRLNVSYEKSHKDKTLAQLGFVFGVFVRQITDYFLECGFNLDEADTRYILYKYIGKYVPELVVDKQLFGGEPRVRHISEIKDRELMSKYIDGLFTVIDQEPIFEGLKLTPDAFYNWVFHLTPEEIKMSQTITDLPEHDEDYLNYTRGLPCIVCGKQHRSDAHHLKDNRLGGISQKSPDWTALPLCHTCHLNIAHGTGYKEAMAWLPISLMDFTRLCYLRWKNKKLLDK